MNFNSVSSLVIPEGNVTSVSFGGKVLWKRRSLEYREVAYLESTGTQKIDTGIAGNNDNLRFELSFNILSFTSYGGIFGNYVAEATNCWRMLQYSNDSGRCYITAGCRANASKLIVVAKNRDHTFCIDKKEYVLNGTATSLGNLAVGTTNERNIYLFTQREDANGSKMRLYYFKVYDSGSLVRDFIPVVDSKGVACLYDKVSSTFFYNVGTGEFTYA